MIQCKDCEFFHQGKEGDVAFSCDPFVSIKEPECLTKWQVIKLNQMVVTYQATLEYYRKLAPMQEKMFKVMEREIDDMNESEKWKVDDDHGHGQDEDHDNDQEQDQEPADDQNPWNQGPATL